MANQFLESFDLDTSPGRRWVLGGNSVVSVSPSFARSGGMGCSIANFSWITQTQNIASPQTGFFGFAFKPVVFPASEVTIFYVSDGSTIQASVSMTSDGHLKCYRGDQSTLLGTSSSTLSLGVYIYLEVEMKIDPSAGIILVKLNGGTTLINVTAANTRTSANSSFSSFSIGVGSGSGSGSSIYIDDVYYNDTSGSLLNSFMGDTRVIGGVPTGNGTLNNYTNTWASWAASTVMVVGQQYKDGNGNIQRVTSVTSDAKTGGSAPTWATTGGSSTTDNHVTTVVVGTGSNPGAANWMAVSEIPPDGDSSYNSDATVNDQDRYVFPSVSGSQVFAVGVVIRADKDDVGTRSVRAVAKSGSTVADNGADFSMAFNSYSTFQGIFQTDPNTGVAWTVAGVNAAEFGVKTTA